MLACSTCPMHCAVGVHCNMSGGFFLLLPEFCSYMRTYNSILQVLRDVLSFVAVQNTK